MQAGSTDCVYLQFRPIHMRCTDLPGVSWCAISMGTDSKDKYIKYKCIEGFISNG